jgi:hypothetical protein
MEHLLKGFGVSHHAVWAPSLQVLEVNMEQRCIFMQEKRQVDWCQEMYCTVRNETTSTLLGRRRT